MGFYMEREHGERRKGHSLEEIVRLAVHTLKEETSILAPEEHSFLRMLIAREQRSVERWEKIKIHVLGWGVVGLVGWLGGAILESVAHWIKSL